MRQFIRPVLVVVAVTTTVLLLARPMPPPWSTPRLARVGDLGHFFLFGGLTLAFWWLFRRRLLRAFLGALVLNGLCEAGQLLSARNADVMDFLRGLAGSLAMVALIRLAGGSKSLVRSGLFLTAALLLAVWPVVEGAPYLADMVDEYRRFPVLCDFRSPVQTTRWACRDAEIGYVPPSGEDDAPAAQITFYRPRAAVSLYPVVRDWSGYRRLCLELSTPGQSVPLVVVLRIGSGDGAATREFLCRCGHQVRRVTFDLRSGSLAAVTSPPTLPGISGLTLTVNEAEKPRVVRVHRIYLE